MNTAQSYQSHTAGSGAAANAPGLPDVNAETYPYDYVQYLLDQTADFSLFAIPAAHRADTATLTPDDPDDYFGLNGGYGLSLHSTLHRFNSVLQTPSPEIGFRVTQPVGESAGTFRCRCVFGTNDLTWLPGSNPPPAIYDPWHSQRFAMLSCLFSFEGSDFFRGYGTGCTFPVVVNARPQVLVGAVGNLMEGFGKFAGLNGTFVCTGRITPELGFLGSITCRIVDPDGQLRSDREISSLTAIEDPDPDDTFLMLRGVKKDKSVMTTYGPPPGGNLVSLITPSQMRGVRNNFTNPGGRLRTEREVGQVIGDMVANVFFDLTAPPGTAQKPEPFTTQEVYTFRDDCGRAVGTIEAGVVEGISFGLKFPAAPRQPGVRFAGFGPITGGTGPFAGVQGMLTVNSLIGIAPHALSLLHVLHIVDPDGRFGANRSRYKRSYSLAEAPKAVEMNTRAADRPEPLQLPEASPFQKNIRHLDQHASRHLEWRRGFRKCSEQLSALLAATYNRIAGIGEFPGLQIDRDNLNRILLRPVESFDAQVFNRFRGAAKARFHTYDLATGRELGSSDLYSYWDPGWIKDGDRYVKRVTGSDTRFYLPDQVPDLSEKKVDILTISYRSDVGMCGWTELYQHGRAEKTSISYRLPHDDEGMWFVKDISKDGRLIENNVFMASHEWKKACGDRLCYYMIGIFFEIDFDQGTARIFGDQFWKALYVAEDPPDRQTGRDASPDRKAVIHKSDPFMTNLRHLDEYTNKYLEWRSSFRKCSRQISSVVSETYNSLLKIGDFPGLPIDGEKLKTTFEAPIKPFDDETFNRYSGSAKGTFRIYQLSTGRELQSSVLYSHWHPGWFEFNGRFAKKITGGDQDYYPPESLPDASERKVDLLINSYRPDTGIVSWVEIYQHRRQQRTSFAYKLPHPHEVLWFVKDVSMDDQPIENQIFMASHEWKTNVEGKFQYNMVGIFFEIDFDACSIHTSGNTFWRALYVEERQD